MTTTTRGPNPRFLFSLALFLAIAMLMFSFFAVPESFSPYFNAPLMPAVTFSCLLLISLSHVYHLFRSGAHDTGGDSRWDILPSVVLPVLYAVLLTVLQNGGVPYRIVFAAFITTLSLLFSFPVACSLSCFALLLVSLKALYLGLPFDGILNASLVILINLFKYALDRQQTKLSEQERAVKQARIAATELASLNIRLQESVYFSMTEIQSREKRRIAAELHDNIGHILTSLLLSVRNRRHADDPGAEAQREHEENTERLIKSAIAEFRKHVYVLRNESEMNLSWPLRWRRMCLVFSDCTGVRVQLRVQDDLGDVTDGMGETIMRIMKEALSNAVRHGNASLVAITMMRDVHLGLLMLKVSDNGSGALVVKPALGLQGMSERVKAQNGRIGWVTRPGSGFDLGVDLPFRPSQAG